METDSQIPVLNLKLGIQAYATIIWWKRPIKLAV